MRILAVTVAVAWAGAWAGAAGAQGRWDEFRDDETGARGAEVCPIDGSTAEDRFCLLVGCREGQPLGFGILASGQYLDLEMEMRVAVDGASGGVLAFVLTDQADRWSDMGAPLEEQQLSLLDRLRAGDRATLSFETLLESHEVEVGLGGSSAAIGAALDACPLPDFAATEAAASASADPATEAAGSTGADPETEAAGSTDADPATEAAGSTDADPATEAAGSTDADPDTEAAGSTGADPETEAAGSTGADPETEAAGSTGADPETEAAGSTGADTSVE